MERITGLTSEDNEFDQLKGSDVLAVVRSWGVSSKLLKDGMDVLLAWDESSHWDQRLLVGRILSLALAGNEGQPPPETECALPQGARQL